MSFNWMALAIFLVSAMTVVGFSAVTRKRGLELKSKREQMSKLSLLSQAFIGIPDAGISSIAGLVADVFGLKYCAIYVPLDGSWEQVSLYTGEVPDAFAVANGVPAWRRLIDECERGVRYVRIRAGTSLIGILAIQPRDVPAETLDAIASVLALALDRFRLSPFCD